MWDGDHYPEARVWTMWDGDHYPEARAAGYLTESGRRNAETFKERMRGTGGGKGGKGRGWEGGALRHIRRACNFHNAGDCNFGDQCRRRPVAGVDHVPEEQKDGDTMSVASWSEFTLADADGGEDSDMERGGD
ncbi:hypothetical protein CYMTET_35442 [Cymbomonas tetramitiformis]|uniref:Uncharacterized protein n=1 Tax=Cymbomonas tetramitiformis TaxID=36881 RepID=A0AAE0F9C2_9CHLO|nr:hypothetical protein CYMTET_35442 [Cymbomonas tetramitiformis]